MAAPVQKPYVDPRTIPIDAKTIAEYLSTQDDFAFELEVYRQLRGFNSVTATHNGTYSDPITGNNRQFDIRADIEIGNHALLMAVECKNLRPSFPLIISCVPRSTNESYHDVLAKPPRVGFPDQTYKSTRKKGDASIYQTEKPTGKSTFQLGRNEKGGLITGDAEVFQKWAQAVASSYGLVERSARAFHDGNYRYSQYVVLPCVVVPNGTLWQCSYTEDGQRLDPTPADEVQFFLGHSLEKEGQQFTYTFSHLTFFSVAGILAFLERCISKTSPADRLFL